MNCRRIGKQVFMSMTLLALAAGLGWAAPQSTDLLRLENAKLEYVSDPWLAAEETAGLADGDTLTACHFKTTADLPLDLVYSFGGDVVSPQGYEVQLQVDEASNSIVGRVELFGSIVSPQIGYQLLREDPVYAANTPQAFAFLPVGVKWLRVRFNTYGAESGFAVADLKVLGRSGPPETQYAFKQTPASALDVLGHIKRVSGDFKLTPEEEDLFSDALDRKLDHWSFEEALLLASGARDSEARKAYLARLDALEQEAKAGLAGLAKPFAKGEHLLKWLHDQVLTAGYQSGQSDVTRVLDDHTYNCVSSAVIYNLVARRLGLDARAVQVPDHVFSILYAGLEHADVETTTPDGFNPARDPEVIRQFYQDTGLVYIPEEHKAERREIGETGLAAAVVYNHGVDLAETGKFQESLLAFFRALSLDGELYTAIHNALAVFGHWSLALVEEGQFPEALKVLEAGLELAPQDSGLRFARQAVWFGWADAVLDQGDQAQALDILRRAAQAVPEGNFEALQAWVFIKPGTALARAGQWKKAVKLAAAGAKQLPPAALDELGQWHRSLYYVWADGELEKGNFSRAVKVLEQGLRAFPGERELRSNLAHAAYRWTLDTWKSKGLNAARKLLAKLVKRHAAVPDMREAVAAFLSKVVESLLDAEDFEKEALAALESFRGLMPAERDFIDLVEYVYDKAAGRFLRQQKWQEALDLYARALKMYPQSGHLQHNQDAVWDAWIGSRLRAGDFEGALKICGQALQKAADQEHFKGKLAFLAQEYSEALYRSRGYEGAEDLLKRLRGQYPGNRDLKDVVAGYVQRRLEEIKHLPDYQRRADEIIRRCKPLLEDEETGQKMELSVYDDRALKFMKEKNWEAAIKVYEEALRYYPDEEHVRHNAVAAWDAWVRDCQQRKDWRAAMEVCSQGAQRSIDPGHFYNNLAYSGQEFAMETYKEKGAQKSAALLRDLLQRYPQVKDLREAAKGHFQHALKELRNDDPKAYEQQGLALVELGRKTLDDASYGQDLYGQLYDQLADRETEAEEWERAIGWYNKALKKYPGDKHMTHNLIVTWNHWAQQYIKTKEWKKAISIYEKALKAFPDDGTLKNNLGYCQEQMGKKK